MSPIAKLYLVYLCTMYIFKLPYWIYICQTTVCVYLYIHTFTVDPFSPAAKAKVVCGGELHSQSHRYESHGDGSCFQQQKSWLTGWSIEGWFDPGLCVINLPGWCLLGTVLGMIRELGNLFSTSISRDVGCIRTLFKFNRNYVRCMGYPKLLYSLWSSYLIHIQVMPHDYLPMILTT